MSHRIFFQLSVGWDKQMLEEQWILLGWGLRPEAECPTWVEMWVGVLLGVCSLPLAPPCTLQPNGSFSPSLHPAFTSWVPLASHSIPQSFFSALLCCPSTFCHVLWLLIASFSIPHCFLQALSIFQPLSAFFGPLCFSILTGRRTGHFDNKNCEKLKFLNSFSNEESC